MNEKEFTPSENPENSPGLSSLLKQRDQLLKQHETILSGSVKKEEKTEIPETDFDDLLSKRFDGLNDLIDIQQKKIAQLLKAKKKHAEMQLNVQILEETNEKLIKQIILMDNDSERIGELENLVETQRKELSKLRINLRKSRSALKQLQFDNGKLKEEKARIEQLVEKFKLRLESQLNEAHSDAIELQNLRGLMKEQKAVYDSLKSNYNRLQDEYNKLFNRVTNSNNN